jgi:hypothetical protein
MNHLNLFVGPDGIPGPDNPVLGLKVVMPVACPKCRNRLAIIGPGKEPYAASLTCAPCCRHCGWLTKQETDFINNIISTFGRPTAPIVLRSKLLASGAVRCQPGRRSSPAPGGHHHA